MQWRGGKGSQFVKDVVDHPDCMVGRELKARVRRRACGCVARNKRRGATADR